METFTPITTPMEVEFFTIFSQDGERYIHLHGYIYRSDDYWANMEACGIIIPLDQFIKNYNERGMDELYEQAKQYQGDYDETEIVEVINHYYRDIVFSIPRDEVGNPDAWLNYGEITDATPDGSYIC